MLHVVAAFGLCLVSPTAKAKAAKSDEHVYNICVINSYLSPDCFVSMLPLASFGCRTSRGPDGAIDVALLQPVAHCCNMHLSTRVTSVVISFFIK